MKQKKAWKKLVAGLRGMGMYPRVVKCDGGRHELELRDDEVDRLCAIVPIPPSRLSDVGMLRALRERGYLK